MTLDEANKFLKSFTGPSYEWKDTHIDIIVRAKGRCEYCDEDLLKSDSAFFSSEWEHIDPQGEFTSHNIALSCKRCNGLKSDDLPNDMTREQFVALDRTQRIQRIREWLSDTIARRQQGEIVEAFKVLICSERKRIVDTTQDL